MKGDRPTWIEEEIAVATAGDLRLSSVAIGGNVSALISTEPWDWCLIFREELLSRSCGGEWSNWRR